MQAALNSLKKLLLIKKVPLLNLILTLVLVCDRFFLYNFLFFKAPKFA